MNSPETTNYRLKANVSKTDYISKLTEWVVNHPELTRLELIDKLNEDYAQLDREFKEIVKEWE